jgi:adenylate cyclase
MDVVNTWEIRTAKIVCILITGMSAVMFIMELPNPKDELLDNVLVKCGILLMFISTVIGFFRISVKSYNKYILIIACGMFLGFNIMVLGHQLNMFRMPSEQVLGPGRTLEHIFIVFPFFALLSLFIFRLWAVFLWLALSLIQPLKDYFIFTRLEQVYFTSDAQLLANDGNAVSEGRFFDYVTLYSLYLVAIASVAFYTRWVLKSTVELEKSRANYSRYFSPDVRDEIESSTNNANEKSSRDLTVAVMFTDIVGFTKLSEKMQPKEVLELLSEYQTLMVDAIFQHKGTVDKFIGDAVMANFGTPKSHGNDAQNAFDCALLMNKKLSDWNIEREKKGLVKIEHRIGIHYGPCVAGNMGSEQRVEFAVIGDVVNVASRICDACKEFDTNFLVSLDLEKKVTHKQDNERVSNYKIRGRKDTIDLVKIY